MRQVAHGLARFNPDDLARVCQLMLMQCSATRAAYQFMRKSPDSVGNQIKKHVKKNYMKDLNQRYLSDACGIASQKRNVPGVIFGGKRAWKELQAGKIAKEQWQERRNSLLYSRGDKTMRGNPNIRVEGNKILVNDPASRGRWIEGDFWMPKKFRIEPSCYDVRLLLRDGKVEVRISSTVVDVPVVTHSIDQGTVGVDCNPDGVALAETDEKGNLVHHQYEREQRIRFAQKGKRTYDVRQLAVRVVDYALERRKPLVLESFRFYAGKQRNSKFQRMKHNYLHRQMLDAIKSRAARMGVEVSDVQPAYTSVLGKLKYQDMYSLNNHTAAALVIARRGMGIKERQTFTDTRQGRGGSRVKLEARSREHTLKPKSWSWLKNEFLRPKNSRAHSPASGSSNVAGIGGSSGEIPGGESGPTTGRSRRLTKSDVNGG